MENFIIWAIVILTGIWILRGMFRSEADRQTDMGPGDTHKKFKISVSREVFKEIECFSVKYKGDLNFGPRSGSYRVVLHLLDVTSASVGEPVLCLIPQLQTDNSPVFEYRSDTQEIPPVGYYVKFENVIRIPIASLVLPYSGKRKILFSAEVKLGAGLEQPQRIVLDGLGPFASASRDYSYVYEQTGYKEKIEGRIRYEESALRLAVAIAKCDGKFDNHEQLIIKEWCREISKTYDEDAVTRVSKRLQKVASEAGQDAQEPRQVAISAARKLRDAPEHEKLAAFELCAKVAGADSKTAPSESKLLTLAAKEMNANMEHVATIMDKHLPIQASSSSTVASLLGITPNMSKAAKKKLLLEEFSKWNRRTASPDPEVKRKADQMLKYIATERQRINE